MLTVFLSRGSSVVEQWTENPRVGSSILPLGTEKLKVSKVRSAQGGQES